MRTIVDLPAEQLDALTRICREKNISRAEAIRRAVDRMIQESSANQKEAAFGIWKNKQIESRTFVEKMRAEWKE